ncbi:MAG: hypothetical protein EOP49_52380, partial [Sphingobacteriales bacterium]
MKKLIFLAAICSLIACNKPGSNEPDPNPNPDPGGQPKPLTITTITPETGNGATLTITITGTGFHPTPSQNEVKLGNLICNVGTASATQLVVGLPLNITEGFYDVVVKANGKTTTRTAGFHYTADLPSITTISPEQGNSGTTTVTITGTGFNPIGDFRG